MYILPDQYQAAGEHLFAAEHKLMQRISNHRSRRLLWLRHCGWIVKPVRTRQSAGRKDESVILILNPSTVDAKSKANRIRVVKQTIYAVRGPTHPHPDTYADAGHLSDA